MCTIDGLLGTDRCDSRCPAAAGAAAMWSDSLSSSAAAALLLLAMSGSLSSSSSSSASWSGSSSSSFSSEQRTSRWAAERVDRVRDGGLVVERGERPREEREPAGGNGAARPRETDPGPSPKRSRTCHDAHDTNDSQNVVKNNAVCDGAAAGQEQKKGGHQEGGGGREKRRKRGSHRIVSRNVVQPLLLILRGRLRRRSAGWHAVRTEIIRGSPKIQ